MPAVSLLLQCWVSQSIAGSVHSWQQKQEHVIRRGMSKIVVPLIWHKYLGN